MVVKRESGALVRTTKAKVPRKEVSKMNFIDIIEDTKSGMAAKSEIDSKEKKAFLKKQNDLHKANGGS